LYIYVIFFYLKIKHSLFFNADTKLFYIAFIDLCTGVTHSCFHDMIWNLYVIFVLFKPLLFSNITVYRSFGNTVLRASIETQADRDIIRVRKPEITSFLTCVTSTDIILQQVFAIVHVEVMIGINLIFLYVSALRCRAVPPFAITAGIMAHDTM